MNAFLSNETDPGVTWRGPRPAIDPGVNAPSQVGSTVRIDGELLGHQDLFVDGEVNGKVVLLGYTLTIGPKARVKASLKAKSVVLVGNVEGNIEATERIELRSNSSLVGEIRSPRVMIENGAYVKGTIEVIRPGLGVSASQTVPHISQPKHSFEPEPSSETPV